LEPIRVLIVDMPGILHDIVREALRGAQDVVVVADVPDADTPIDLEIERTDPSVVVLGADHPAIAAGVAVLADRARLKFLAVGADGAETTLYEMEPHRIALGELSPSALVSAVRDAGAAA
jgi:chemotaxis response regulator CheB